MKADGYVSPIESVSADSTADRFFNIEAGQQPIVKELYAQPPCTESEDLVGVSPESMFHFAADARDMEQLRPDPSNQSLSGTNEPEAVTRYLSKYKCSPDSTAVGPADGLVSIPDQPTPVTPRPGPNRPLQLPKPEGPLDDIVPSGPPGAPSWPEPDDNPAPPPMPSPALPRPRPRPFMRVYPGSGS